MYITEDKMEIMGPLLKEMEKEIEGEKQQIDGVTDSIQNLEQMEIRPEKENRDRLKREYDDLVKECDELRQRKDKIGLNWNRINNEEMVHLKKQKKRLKEKIKKLNGKIEKEHERFKKSMERLSRFESRAIRHIDYLQEKRENKLAPLRDEIYQYGKDHITKIEDLRKELAEERANTQRKKLEFREWRQKR